MDGIQQVDLHNYLQESCKDSSETDLPPLDCLYILRYQTDTYIHGTPILQNSGEELVTKIVKKLCNLFAVCIKSIKEENNDIILEWQTNILGTLKICTRYRSNIEILYSDEFINNFFNFVELSTEKRIGEEAMGHGAFLLQNICILNTPYAQKVIFPQHEDNQCNINEITVKRVKILVNILNKPYKISVNDDTITCFYIVSGFIRSILFLILNSSIKEYILKQGIIDILLNTFVWVFSDLTISLGVPNLSKFVGTTIIKYTNKSIDIQQQSLIEVIRTQSVILVNTSYEVIQELITIVLLYKFCIQINSFFIIYGCITIDKDILHDDMICNAINIDIKFDSKLFLQIPPRYPNNITEFYTLYDTLKDSSCAIVPSNTDSFKYIINQEPCLFNVTVLLLRCLLFCPDDIIPIVIYYSWGSSLGIIQHLKIIVDILYPIYGERAYTKRNNDLNAEELYDIVCISLLFYTKVSRLVPSFKKLLSYFIFGELLDEVKYPLPKNRMIAVGSIDETTLDTVNNTSFRARILIMLLDTDADIASSTGNLLYTLCNENSDEFIRLVGFGRAAGTIASHTSFN